MTSAHFADFHPERVEPEEKVVAPIRLSSEDEPVEPARPDAREERPASD